MSQLSVRIEHGGRAITKTHLWKDLVNVIDIIRENVQDPRGRLRFRGSPNEQGQTTYLPVGIRSKNDKGACINEFSIFVEPRVSDSIQRHGDGTGSLTLSCSCFELLSAHNNSNEIVAIARNKSDRS